LVNFALGSDTGGSVRVPSSFCGLYGLRPTHGRIPLDGVLIQASSYDTIGWFADDPETFARVGEVLLRGQIPETRPQHLIIAEDAFELADPEVVAALKPKIDLVSSLFGQTRTERLSPNGLIEWSAQQLVLQGREAWESARDWLDRVNPRLSFEVGDRYGLARQITDVEIAAARSARGAIVNRMKEVFADGTFICMPTTVSPAPPTGQRLSDRTTLRARNSALTSVAGTTGAPQINLPLADLDGLPVGLSLIGSPGADEQLIALARVIKGLAG
jgi:amidase